MGLARAHTWARQICARNSSSARFRWSEMVLKETKDKEYINSCAGQFETRLTMEKQKKLYRKIKNCFITFDVLNF